MSERIVVVSGGGSGIGRAVAVAQASQGQTVLVTGRRRDALAETAALATSGAIEVVAADLSTPDGVSAVVDAVGDRDVIGLVASAGAQGTFNTPGPTLPEIDAAWSEALRLNLFSAVLLVEALTPALADRDGRVVLVGSTAGLNGAGGAYAAAKAALHSYGRTIARSLGKRGITANVVAPGFVTDTDFFDPIGGLPDAETLARSAARTLVGRLGTPADVAGCINWLLSPDAGWTTGQVISPNGGVVLVR